MGDIFDDILKSKAESPQEKMQRERLVVEERKKRIAAGETLDAIISEKTGIPPISPSVQSTPGLSSTAQSPLQAAPGFGTQLKAEIVNHPETKMKIYAAARFPDLPTEEAIKRYGIVNNKIIYQADDGEIYSETPEDFATNIQRFAASFAAGIPEMAGAVVGFALAGPAGAAAGGAGGETARMAIATALGENIKMEEAATNLGLTAILGAATGVGARGQTRLIEKSLQTGAPAGGKALVRGASRELPYLNMPEAIQIMKQGKKYGIDVPVAGATESSELINRISFLSKRPETADVIRGARNKLVEQVEAAVPKQISAVSPGRTMTPGQNMIAARDAAKTAIKNLEGSREGAVTKYYEAAFAKNPEVFPLDALTYIDNALREAKGVRRQGLLQLRKLFLTADSTNKKEIIDVSLRGLHNTKIAIDGMFKGLEKQSIKKASARDRQEVKRLLLEAMDSASPEYKDGRLRYALLSPRIDAMKESLVGTIANASDENLAKIGKQIFMPGALKPEMIANARAAIRPVRPEAWDNMVMDHLDGIWQGIPQNIKGPTNMGGRFRKAFFGTKAQREALEAALSPEQFKNLSSFAEVLRRTGLVFSEESATASFGALSDEIKREATPLVIRVGQNISLDRPLRPVADTFQRMFFEERSMRRLAVALFDKDAAKELTKMRHMKPRSKKLLESFIVFVNQVGLNEYESRNRGQNMPTIPISMGGAR